MKRKLACRIRISYFVPFLLVLLWWFRCCRFVGYLLWRTADECICACVLAFLCLFCLFRAVLLGECKTNIEWFCWNQHLVTKCTVILLTPISMIHTKGWPFHFFGRGMDLSYIISATRRAQLQANVELFARKREREREVHDVKISLPTQECAMRNSLWHNFSHSAHAHPSFSLFHSILPVYQVLTPPCIYRLIKPNTNTHWHFVSNKSKISSFLDCFDPAYLAVHDRSMMTVFVHRSTHTKHL